MNCEEARLSGQRRKRGRDVAGEKASSSKQARKDLAEISAFYGEESLEVELRFIDAARKAFEKLSRNPKMGAVREYLDPKLEGLRMWPIARFTKVLIFYKPVDDGIEVVRVLHSARDIEALFANDEVP
jgi:toxin ParE1/3/4